MKLGKFRKFNFLCFILISLPLTIFDQITKQWAITLKNQPPIKVVEGFWNFVYVENSGALWGMGATFPPIYRKLIFVGLS
ncbi:MAG: signal peptidase II, partial [bacterium]